MDHQVACNRCLFQILTEWLIWIDWSPGGRRQTTVPTKLIDKTVDLCWLITRWQGSRWCSVTTRPPSASHWFPGSWSFTRRCPHSYSHSCHSSEVSFSLSLVIALRPQTPKHIRGGYTDTSKPVDGNGAQNMVTVQSGFEPATFLSLAISHLSITGPRAYQLLWPGRRGQCDGWDVYLKLHWVISVLMVICFDGHLS
jgi:hypothetical protein